MSLDIFSGRKLVVASMHKKEEIIAPIIEHHLPVKCMCAEFLNTDLLGTFSGEIPREQNAYLTAVKKCELALAITGNDLAIASEGSFGPHPHAFMINVNEELLVLLDSKNNIKIKASCLSLETNYHAQQIDSLKELESFSKSVKFPSHAIILSNTKENFTQIEKGIRDTKTLYEIANTFLSKFGSFYAQTDMRSHMNPSRQKVIQQATYRLIEKLNSSCPNCQIPGFDCVRTINGLPCEYCHFPTRLAMKRVFECEHCNYSEERLESTTEQFASQAFCDLCNP